ncbi:hypothetical protein BC832DRAFT_170322 [Gaertneriomyces semiglobifer]|nr:hypothetical protein BC832DRAFT_170322 [Gaertneriomyces semiglobifer]
MITISDLLNPDDATASVTVHTQYPSPGPLTTLPSSFESSIYAKRSSWPDLTLRLPGVTTLLVEPRCAFTAITPSTPYSSYRYPCSPSSSFTFPPREYGDHRPSLAPSEVCSLPSSDCSESYIKHPYHHTKDTFEKSPNLARRNTMSATDANAGKKKQHACPVCHRGFSRLCE